MREVEAWVDAAVALPGPLSRALCDLVAPGFRSPLDWLPLLRSVDGALHPEVVQRRLAERLLRILDERDGAEWIRGVRVIGALPVALEDLLLWATEDLSLIAQGYVAGTDADVVARLRSELLCLVAEHIEMTLK